MACACSSWILPRVGECRCGDGSGLATVRACANHELCASRYVATPFNFNIFPSTMTSSLDSSFSCQASSLKFLASNKFDFDKFISKGVPFLSKAQEEWVTEYKLSMADQPEEDIMSMRNDDIEFLDSVVRQVSLWKSVGDQGGGAEEGAPLQEGAYFVLEPNNTFRCKLVRQGLRRHCDDMFVSEEEEDQVGISNRRHKILRITYVGAGKREVGWATACARVA